MEVVFSFLMAVAPALLLVMYYYKQDKNKPEPKGLLTKIFFLGVISIIPIILIEYILDFIYQVLFGKYELFYYFLRAFVVAAFCEEIFKLLIVMKFAYPNPHFDESVDGIIYCIVASLGFACFENVLYVIDSGFTTAILRAFTAVPLHAIVSGIMGFYVGQAKFSSKENEFGLIAKGFFFAVFLHGIYDFFIFSIPVFGIVPALLNIPLIIWGFIFLKRKIKYALNDDIINGRIDQPKEFLFIKP